MKWTAALTMTSCLLVAATAAAQDYNHPVTKAKRECAILEAERDKVRDDIARITKEISADPRAFYEAHKADCVVTNDSKTDFEFEYKPLTEWEGKRARLNKSLLAKKRELLDAYDAEISQLDEMLPGLKRHQEAWKTSLARLEGLEGDLKQQEGEWRKARRMALWETTNNLLPFLQAGTGKLLETVAKAPAGSLWARLPDLNKEKVTKALEVLGATSKAACGVLKGGDALMEAAGEKDQSDKIRKTSEAGRQLSEAVNDLLPFLVNATAAQVKEAETLRLIAMKWQDIAHLGLSASSDPTPAELSGEIGTSVRDFIKLWGLFFPPAKLAEEIEAAGEAGLETWLAHRALKTVAWAANLNRENLGKAKANLEELGKELASIQARRDQFAAERTTLQAELKK